jgi:hypothetical protein
LRGVGVAAAVEERSGQVGKSRSDWFSAPKRAIDRCCFRNANRP